MMQFLRWGIVAAVLGWHAIASAQLATNLGIDIRAMSMGNAVTASPPGISAVHFNPAGLAKLEGRRMDLQFLGVDLALESTFTAPPGYGVFGFSDDPVVCTDAPDDGNSACSNFVQGKSTVEGVGLYVPIADDFIELPPGPLIAGPVPAFSIKPPGSKFTFASATYLPMAAGLYREDDDPGNFMGQRMAIERITMASPSVAYQINDELSVGLSVGFSYQAMYLQTQTRAPNQLTAFARIIDEGICAPFAGQSNIALDIFLGGLCRPKEGLGPYKSLAELEVKLEQRLSPSWNLGVLWEPNEHFGWGAVWHAPVKVKMTGDYKITYANATRELINGVGASPTGSLVLAILGVPNYVAKEDVGILTTELTMPAHFQTGIKYKFHFGPELLRRLQLNVDAVWVDYGEWDALSFQFDRPSPVLALAKLFAPGSTNTRLSIPLGFQSTWNFAFGAEYELTERLTLRGGYEPRASAIPTDRRTPMVPINKAQLFGLGLTYKWDTDTEIDLGLSTIRSKDSIPANTSCMANCEGIDNVVYNPYAGLDIETEAEINIVGVAFRTSF